MPKKASARLGTLAAAAAREAGPLLIRSLVEHSDFSTVHISMKPGARHPAVRHDRTTEFFMVLRGGATGRIDGRPCAFAESDYALLPPGCVHEFTAGPAGLEVLSIFVPALDPDTPDIVFDEPKLHPPA